MAKNSVRLFLLACVSLAISACSGGQWVSSLDREAFAQVVAHSRTSKVVIVGEFHNRRQDHELQLAIIKGLHEAGVPLAIGMEMFDLESQPYLDRWVEGKMDLKEFQDVYRQNWSINWPEYDSLLLYARKYKIPLIGLNAPPDLVTRVLHSGFSALGATDRARLPSGVRVVTSAAYRSFLDDAFSSHAMPEESFMNFCEAQALRNSTMARRIASYAASHQKTCVVAITGIGHAIRRALGDELQAVGLPSSIIIPVAEAGIFDRLRRDDADYFLTWD